MKKRVVLFVLALVLSFSSLSFVTESKASAARGGYVNSKYYAQGGRVNIVYNDLYLNVTDARKYASKSEVSIKEGFVWFGAALYTPASAYVSTVGLYRATEASLFASAIRKYTDKNQAVHITLSKDKNYPVGTRIVKSWDGKTSSIKPFAVPAPQYQTVIKKGTY